MNRCNQGKMVFEFKPKIDWNKGKALVWLLQALGLDEHEDVFTIYIGDDTTDEDAFEVFQMTDKRKGEFVEFVWSAFLSSCPVVS